MSCGGGGNGNGRERRELGKSAMNTPLNCYPFCSELLFKNQSVNIGNKEGFNISYLHYVDH